MVDTFGEGDRLVGRRIGLPDGRSAFIPGSIAFAPDGETPLSAVPAGVDRSGTAGTTSAQLAPSNPMRRSLNIQNISANTLGVNEFGGVAAIGAAGTYTVPAGASINVRTNRQINVVASAASTAFTATEA